MSDPKVVKQQPPKRPANPAPQASARPAAPVARLASIDALRGFDMFWIVGGQGLIVSLLALLATRFAFAAGWKAFADEQLKHTTWEGFTAYDLIMPLFLFVVGVAMPFSIGQRIATGQSTGRIYRKVLLRVLILWVLGMIAQGNLLKFGTDEKQTLLLFSNTLQAIAIGYLVAAIALIHLPRWGQALVTLGMLGLYWALMHWVPFAGHAAGTMEEKANLALFLDSKILGRFQAPDTTYAWILPSLGFAASVLLGVHSGQILRSSRSHAMKVFWLIVLGLVCLAAGGLMAGWPVEFLRGKGYHPAGFVGQLMDWSYNGRFPLVKHLFTSSMVLWAAGWCCLLLALFYLVVDVLGLRAWAFPFIVIGMNAIVAYMLCHPKYLPEVIANEYVAGLAGLWSSDKTKALVIAAAAFALLWAFLYWMYRNRNFLRI